MSNNNNTDFSDIKQILKELAISQKQTDEQMKKTDKKLEKMAARFDAQQAKTDAQLAKTDAQLAKTDAQLAKTDAQLAKTDAQLAKTDKKLAAVGKQLGDIGIVQGEIGEDLIYRNVRGIFKKRKKIFDRVARNYKGKNAEYDVIAINGSEILVVEVKNKLTYRMIDKFLNKQISKFRKNCPEFKPYKIIGAVGSLVVKDEVEKYAENKGLFVITQSSNGNAEIVNSKKFVAKEF